MKTPESGCDAIVIGSGIGGVGDAPGPNGQFGRALGWLTDGRLRFASIGSPYDIVKLPGFEFPIEAPREALVRPLAPAFHDDAAASVVPRLWMQMRQ